MASASGGGNRLIFKPSPLKAPPAASISPSASIGHGNRDDVTLFIPGKVDGATLPFLQAGASQAAPETKGPIADPIPTAGPVGRLGLYVALTAALGLAAVAGILL